MFSIGEAVIILGVGSWAFGPKELPRMGRALGRLTGRATGFIYKARAQLFDFAEKAELTKVQQELQMTMQQLQSIRNELQGGINILNPGPLTRQVLGSSGSGGGALTGSLNSSSSNSADNSNIGATLDNKHQQPQQNNLPFAASGAATTTATGTTPQGLLQSPPLQQQPHSHNHLPFEVLPISAAAAGLIPDRSQSRPSVSEILADALQEEKVAHQALQFFQQQPQPQPQQQQVVVENTTTASSSSDSCNRTNRSGSSTVKKRKPRSKKKAEE